MIAMFFIACSSQMQDDDVKFLIPIRGTCLKAPTSDIPGFVNFIGKERVNRGVNVLVLRVEYSLEWESHPEVHDVLNDLFDETIALFESTALHVGMDEVFILGEDSCKNG